MKKRIPVIIISLIFVFSLVACKQKETPPPVPKTPGPMMPGQAPSGQMPMGQMPPGQMPPAQTPMGQMPPGQMPPGQMPPTGQQQTMRPGMGMAGKIQVLVPNSVKGKWSGAKIVIEDKTSKSKQEYTVKLNSDFKVPNSNLKIQVGEFLPDFEMGQNLTSKSNEPINPALGIKVFEKDKQIFPAPGRQWGWLFAKVPSIHPFEHSKYSIILKEGVKKG
jgi:hypothetical protein